ncbi:MAG: 4'-phosphopantetheinyl transferase superfamily protein [Bacteroidota bacterium]|nr:4'-phosphopantetheinyl transferase superfamily protein [Bacteroidota bacterium]
MPLIKEVTILPFSKVLIWHITEPNTFFLKQNLWSPDELTWLHSIHPSKQKDYLASRTLIYQTLAYDSGIRIFKDEFGKPKLTDGLTQLSISHSEAWTGMSFGRLNSGFDLQVYADKILHIAPRFLNNRELSLIQSIEDPELTIPLITLFWCIKEAVYKCFGQKGVHFKEQISIHWIHAKELDIHILNAQLTTTNNLYENYIIHYAIEKSYAWALALQN